MTCKYWVNITFTPEHLCVQDRSLLKWIAYRLESFDVVVTEDPLSNVPYLLSLPISIEKKDHKHFRDVLDRYIVNKLKLEVEDWLVDNFYGKPLPFDRHLIFLEALRGQS